MWNRRDALDATVPTPPYLEALHRYVLSRIGKEAPNYVRWASEAIRRRQVQRVLQALCLAHHKPLRAAYRLGGHRAVRAVLPELLGSRGLPWEVARW